MSHPQDRVSLWSLLTLKILQAGLSRGSHHKRVLELYGVWTTAPVLVVVRGLDLFSSQPLLWV